MKNKSIANRSHAHGLSRVRYGLGQAAITSRVDYSRIRGRGVPYHSRRGFFYVDPAVGLIAGVTTAAGLLRRGTGR